MYIDLKLLVPRLMYYVYKTTLYIFDLDSTVKHLLFAWPYFREATILNIFQRLYFRELSSFVL